MIVPAMGDQLQEECLVVNHRMDLLRIVYVSTSNDGCHTRYSVLGFGRSYFFVI